MKELAEILKRINEIEAEVRKGNVSDALSKELDSLLDEKRKIEEKQKTFEARFAQGRTVEIPNGETQERNASKNDIKVIFAKAVRGDSLTDVEKRTFEKMQKRAAGVALTTTATEYVAPSELTDGVNNGGVFIPEELMLDILRSTELSSPFAQDCLIRNLKGVLKFPYKKSNSTPKAKAEGTKNEDASFEWAILELTVYNQTITVPVTYELLAQAIESFADYLLEEIALAIREAISDNILYGKGQSDELTGATIGAIDAVANGYQADKELDALEAGIKLVPKRKKQGAKIYVATDVFNKILFSKDANGAYLYNPFNSNSLKSFGPYPLVEDPSLKDGDFIIGNAKHMILNLIKGINIEEERHPKERKVEYSAHVMLAGKPEPSTFVYGKKAI